MPDRLSEKLRTVLAGSPFEHAGFDDPVQAGSALRDLGERLVQEDLSLLTEILSQILASADPQMALYNLQRFVEVSPDAGAVRIAMKRSTENIQIITTLMAGSQFLSEVLMAQPDAFQWLIAHNTLYGPRPVDYYEEGTARAVGGLSDRAQQRAALSQYRRREYLRIGLRDLLLIADAEEISRDISDLAEAIIDRAAQLIFNDLARRFGLPAPEWLESGDADYAPVPVSSEGYSAGMCVLGMGKLGGRELNFSSDIDLIFIYEAEGQTAGRLDGARRVAVISNHDFFTRLGEALIKFLGERGPDGNLFRVDMRLRPEGIDGPLVRSLEALVFYFKTQARDWERLAYLKARVVSGPPSLAEKLYRVISEFVFLDMDAARIISEVQELKIRIDREVIHSDIYRREVKRGYGGIREIEFVVAAMQIVHGSHHHALRVRNTFLAIQRLREVHILDAAMAEFYLRAYSFLRMIEHRLQMAQEAQTHLLPPPGTRAFEATARRCGFSAGAQFWREYEAITQAVHQHFSDFFQHDHTLLEQAQRDVMTILDRSADEAETTAALRRRGIENPDSLRLIQSLAYGTQEVFVAAEGQRYFEQMLPGLLRMTVASPFPEKVFSHLHSFAMAIKGITYYYEVLAQHPDILKLLVVLFGTSDALSAQFIAHPQFFDNLISARTLNEPDLEGVQRRERMAVVTTLKTHDRRMEMLRSVVKFEQIVAALKYLLRIEPLERALGRLSHIADDALDLAAHLAAARLIARWTGNERPAESEIRELLLGLSRSFVVLAMGKYGGREINFFGDIDVVFVYDQKASLPAWAHSHYSNTQEFFDAFSDSIMTIISEQSKGGRVYAIDARLRPHGRSSPLTTEISAYRAYLRETAEVWELQAFTRARPVWGSRGLYEDLQRDARRRALALPRADLAAEIRLMRSRLEEAADVAPGLLEVKRSAGGLMDVEFLIQYLTLTGQIPWKPESSNYFQALTKVPALTRQHYAAPLRAGYMVLRGVENTIRLVTGAPESSIITDSEAARATATALSLGTAENLEKTVTEAKAVVRRVWNQVLGER